MSSLLRSTKFVRYFCGAARTLILNSARNVESNLLLGSRSLGVTNNLKVRDYATSKKNDSVEPLLQHMDSEIRRSGRISKRNLDDLFDGIKTTKDITSSQALLVIRCCGDLLSEELPQKRTLLVQKIWSVLSEIGVPMDISHYNTLLRVYIENEHPFSPAEFLEELANKELQPNHVTYQRLMWRYCQQGDIEGATKVLENMRELGHPITVPVLNALVMGHSNLGDTDGAKAVLNTVSGAGLQATNHTYALLACGFAMKGDVAGVKEVLDLANNGESFLTNKDIFSIIEAFAVNGHQDKIDSLFDNFEQGPSYKHDAHNAILRLINKGQLEVAKKILRTFMKPRTDDEEEKFYQGAFFIKQTLRSSKSAESIVQICNELQNERIIPNALLIALEASMQQGQVELAQQLLKELSKSGVELRQHYFWPLLVKKGKENDEEGLLQILRSMSTDGLTPTRETLQNYVIPYLNVNKDPNNVIIKLQIANIPSHFSAKCVIAELLNNVKMNEAANLAQQYNIKGNLFIRDPLIFALTRSKDVAAFAKILQITSAKAETVSEEEDDRNGVDVDDIILRAVKSLKTPDLIENLLSTLLSKGIGITPTTAESIEHFLGQNMTPALSETLSKLTSEDLEITPIKKTYSSGRPKNAAEYENLIANLQQKDVEVQGLQKQLLVSYMKDNDVNKVNSLVKELEADETFRFTNTTLSQLMEFYCENNDVDKALHYKNLLLTKFPDYKIYNLRNMQLAHALIKANRVDEAIDLFKNTESDGSNYFIYNTKCWQVLNELAELKNVDKLNEFFDILIEKKFIEPSNVLLGPLIRVHLLRDDLNGALNQFELCCKKYRSTPWKGELMKQLIMAEDATKLQWLADLSTQIHGEVNVLYDLILAFVECGRLRQARRILQTPGLHTRNQRLNTACKRYVNGGQTECIEGLLEATKELSNIDRSNIFNHLLTSYLNADETDKAVGLWNLLQEEGEVPSDTFLIQLGEHLKAKNKDVPFVIPRPTNTKKEISIESKKEDYSNQIEKLLDEGLTNEAADLTLKSLKDDIKPNRRVISYLLKKLSEEGNVKKMLMLKPYYENQKKPINFNHKLTLATVASGSAASFINDLYQMLESDQPIYEDVVRKFPKAEALNTILKDDQLSKKCEEIADILASKDQMLAANLIWMEYIINGEDKKADLIWQKHLQSENFIKYKRLLQHAFVNDQPETMIKLINYLEQNKNVTPEALGNVYSRLVGVYIAKKDPENAKSYLELALSKGLFLKQVNRNTLRKLKSLCKETEVAFDYEIPKVAN